MSVITIDDLNFETTGFIDLSAEQQAAINGGWRSAVRAAIALAEAAIALYEAYEALSELAG